MEQVIQINRDLLLFGLSSGEDLFICQRLTYDNPELAEARQSGRWTKGIPEKLELFHDESTGPFEALRVPRGCLHWIVETLPEAEIRDLRIFPAARINTSGALKPRWYQAEAVRAIVNAEQGIIVAPTGSGKTATAMALIERLQTRAIMLVHNKTLLDQAAQACRSFLGVEPGIIGDGEFSIADVTIATVQTLMGMNLSQLAGQFGLVILDEAHHCPAKTFRAVVSAFPARYRVGLTATPTRADGLTELMLDTIGPIVYQVTADVLMTAGAIVPAEVVAIHTDFDCPVPMKLRRFPGANGKKEEVNYTKLINMLTQDEARNEFILQRVTDLHVNQSLVLTERVEHVAWLAERLSAAGFRAVALTGKSNKKARAVAMDDFKSGSFEFLVSTVALVGEGFDCPQIDTVFLVAPNGNATKTTQVLGRALRPAPGKTTGRIVDFVDGKISVLNGQAARRRRVYRQFMNNGASAA